jgi:outer membrane protein OmpA-like peptidoglycan-associated protein
MFIQRLKPQSYEVAVAKDGYLPLDPFMLDLIEGENNDLKRKLDTTNVVLYPIPVFKMTVINSKTGDPIQAQVTVIDTLDWRHVLKTEVAKNGTTVKLPLGPTYYKALVEAKDFQTQFYPVGVQGLDDITLQFALDPILKGRTFVIKNLFFASNQTQILPQSEPSLRELYEFLSENPGVKIRITGHTDWIGSDEANQKLSEGRAESVKNSMVERGIDPARIETEGKGESQPVDTNETDAGRQNNRRVEFTILEDEMPEGNKVEMQ